MRQNNMCLLSLRTELDEILPHVKFRLLTTYFTPARDSHSEIDCQVLDVIGHDVKGSGFRDKHIIPVFVNPEINLGDVFHSKK